MKYFFAIALIGLSQFSLAQNCSGKLTGHVHSSATHENLERALVKIVELNRALITNSRGDFSFDSVCNGTYTIVVFHQNHDSLAMRVEFNTSKHLDMDLPPSSGTLSEVTVTAQRTQQQTGIKKELSGRELEETRGLALGEVLSKINGVTMLQTGSNISKPVIHGLHGNRILTINNGVRQEGQQWGNEHAPEIDPFIANRLTVIKGVDELRYGSDAIGGVILVEPRALRISPGYSGEINTVYFTNNRQYVVSGIYERQLSKIPEFTFRLQGTYKKGANATTPGYRLNNTGNGEKNFSASMAWRKQRFISELYYSFFDTKAGIFSGAHIGNLTDLQTAIDSEKPDPTFTGEKTYKIGRPYQDVEHHLLKSKNIFQLKNNQRVSLLLASQLNNRQEYDLVRNRSTTKPQLDLSILTVTEEITLEKTGSSPFTRTSGLSAMQQLNFYSGRYFIPDYKSYSWGGYHIQKWNYENWDAQAGIRLDHKRINTNRLSGTNPVPEKYHFNYTTLASSLNVGHRFNEHWKMNATMALSNRAPHVNELLSDGIHHGTATYEEGDINLKPERSLNFSVNNSLSDETGNFIFEASIYRNAIKNFIFLQPKPDEPVLTISGAFPKMKYEQADAVLQGIDLSATVILDKKLEWINRYSLLRAKNKSIDDWLIRMPSDRLQSELVYSFLKNKKISNGYISTEVVKVWEQTRVPDETNGKSDFKVPPPGYFLWNADISATVNFGKQPVTFGIGLRNLLNTSYRDYLNNMRYFADETGRNIQFRIRIPFNQSF